VTVVVERRRVTAPEAAKARTRTRAWARARRMESGDDSMRPSTKRRIGWQAAAAAAAAVEVVAAE
jgi:hypothetical protein